MTRCGLERCQKAATRVVVEYRGGARVARAPRGVCSECAARLISDQMLLLSIRNAGAPNLDRLEWRAEYLS